VPQLVMEVLSQLEGASALLFKSAHYPGQMLACRRGSPLIVGVREAKDRKAGSADQFEAFVASDGAAVVEHTKQWVPSLSLALKSPPGFFCRIPALSCLL